MRPGKFIRTAKGYCCWMCDGPYRRWKKIQRRKCKQTEKRLARKDMERELNQDRD